MHHVALFYLKDLMLSMREEQVNEVMCCHDHPLYTENGRTTNIIKALKQ